MKQSISSETIQKASKLIPNQAELEQNLSNLLQTDQEQFEHYKKLLSTCTKPRHVAEKVVKPMFLDGIISEKDASRVEYYGMLSSLLYYWMGHWIPPKSLYYQITTNFSDWKKQKSEEQWSLQNEACRQQIKIKRYPDGTMELFFTLVMKVLSEDLGETVRTLMELGIAELGKKNKKKNKAPFQRGA